MLASRALVSVDEAFVLRRSCGSGDQPVVFERAVEGFGGGGQEACGCWGWDGVGVAMGAWKYGEGGVGS
jgi:hypothetical protein